MTAKDYPLFYAMMVAGLLGVALLATACVPIILDDMMMFGAMMVLGALFVVIGYLGVILYSIAR